MISLILAALGKTGKKAKSGKKRMVRRFSLYMTYLRRNVEV